MITLSLKLLGSLRVERDDEATLPHFRSLKSMALLGYLAAESRPIMRNHLASLFWDNESPTGARRELRRVLYNLSTLLPGCFQADRRTIHFVPTPECWLDIAHFEILQRQGDPSSLRAAADLYQGELMEGFYLDDCPEFETWLLAKRERWRQKVSQVLQKLVTHYVQQNEYEESINFAQQLLALEPWQEEMHRQLMRLLARRGCFSTALAQYQTCRRILAKELKVEPALETQRLYEQIKAAASLPRHNLPIPSTPFLGRKRELAAIGRLLANPGCRLLTITGPGGIGKTRLALQVATMKVDAFLNGVAFIPLAATDSADLLAITVANALNLPPPISEAPPLQICNYLAQKEMLLLLDNVEAFLASKIAMVANLVSAILSVAPHVKILVTSREALNLREEWLYPVQGFSFPAPQTKTPEPRPGSEYEAVRLFVQQARQVRPDFSLNGEERGVIRICQLVEGMPLAIELAAGWVKVFSCKQIAREIERSLDILVTTHQNIPPRHRSLRAVFESSWRQLSPPEQRLLAKLSLFHGECSQEEVIAATADMSRASNLFLQAALVDKSLLRVRQTAEGIRYQMHELLCQFVAEKLQQMPAAVYKDKKPYSTSHR